MVAVPSTCNLRIKKNQHWEDYKSLKKYWSYQGKYLREYGFDGYVTTTATLAELKDGTDATIAFLGANDIVYVRSEADLEALDGDSIWIDYVSSTGTLYENIESKLDSVTSTATEVPIGCKSGTYVDAVAAVNGSTLTMTNLDESAQAANRLAGWYVVASGDATHEEGNYLTIASNTAANPTVITCTTAPNADWADDNVSIQQTLNNDVYRIRQIRSETEAPGDNFLCVCDKDKTNIYAVIPDGNSQSNHPRYFSLSSSYRCFIGRIYAQAPLSVGDDGDNLEFEIKITYTPKAWDNPDATLDSQVGCDISQTFTFTDIFDWQPCIELEPCTEVIIYIRKVIDQDHSYMRVSFDMLEVYVAA
jgi:hypothetical protein